MIKTIAEWQKEVHKVAVDHGWWEDPQPRFGELIALAHSELSEALESYRHNDGHEDIELADVVIRVLDMAEGLGLDIEKALEEKNEINKLRPYRHGGRRL